MTGKKVVETTQTANKVSFFCPGRSAVLEGVVRVSRDLRHPKDLDFYNRNFPGRGIGCNVRRDDAIQSSSLHHTPVSGRIGEVDPISCPTAHRHRHMRSNSILLLKRTDEPAPMEQVSTDVTCSTLTSTRKYVGLQS